MKKQIKKAVKQPPGHMSGKKPAPVKGKGPITPPVGKRSARMAKMEKSDIPV